jgi:formate dehydrogenase iron-sulfur subunit
VSRVTVYVPRDSAARAVGADETAAALVIEAARRGLEIELVRNGSRGLFWLEPLIEVATPAGRIAYGPVQAEDVPALLDAGLLQGAPHALGHGRVDDIPYLARQQREVFSRLGLADPLSLADYAAHGGWAGLQAALALPGEAVVEQVLASGLRGRGGAAFPAGIKWRTVRGAAGAVKHVVCNADEGDSGTFSDRLVMEGDPYLLIEGLLIAGLAVGATQGWIYVRSEYPDALAALQEAIGRAQAAGWLGDSVAGSGRAFHLHLRQAAGSYVCGEETALLESLEGKRGIVRAKPPLPALQGFMGKPTVVNNVISLASIPVIFEKGAEHYKNFGLGRSRGTIPLQIAGNVKHGGLYEIAFGLTLGEIVDKIGGGTASGRPVKAVQVGGPLGAYFPRSLFDTPFGYEEFAGKDGLIGHAGLTIFDDSADMLEMARFAMEFCAIESCGKCTPCRIGAVRGVETINRIKKGDAAAMPILTDLCNTMKSGSLCALGGFTPYPVMSAVTHFPDDFQTQKEAAE